MLQMLQTNSVFYFKMYTYRIAKIVLYVYFFIFIMEKKL